MIMLISELSCRNSHFSIANSAAMSLYFDRDRLSTKRIPENSLPAAPKRSEAAHKDQRRVLKPHQNA